MLFPMTSADFRSRLDRLFSLEELRRCSGSRLLFFFLSLFQLAALVRLRENPVRLLRMSAEGGHELLHAQAPWIPSFFMDLLPYAGQLGLGISLLILICVASLWLLYRERFLEAVLLQFFVLLSRFGLYGLSVQEWEVYYHVSFLFLGVFFFAKNKLLAMKKTLCAVYLMAAAAKISPSWLTGMVFHSVPGGSLPFLPDSQAAAMAASWLLISLEVIGPFLLFHPSLRWRRAAWWAFIAFHLYSIPIINYTFPMLMLGVLIPLRPGAKDPAFGPLLRPLHGLLAALLLASQYHLLLPGTKTFTQQGKFAGLFMFDANAGCRAELELLKGEESIVIRHQTGYRKGVRYSDGSGIPRRQVDRFTGEAVTNGNKSALSPAGNGSVRWKGEPVYHTALACSGTRRSCCDPYVYYRYVQQVKNRFGADKVRLKLSVALNGHNLWLPLVDEADFRPDALGYSFLRHNSWIQLPGPEAPADYRWP
jgi:hypothetical protein